MIFFFFKFQASPFYVRAPSSCSLSIFFPFPIGAGVGAGAARQVGMLVVQVVELLVGGLQVEELSVLGKLEERFEIRRQLVCGAPMNVRWGSLQMEETRERAWVVGDNGNRKVAANGVRVTKNMGFRVQMGETQIVGIARKDESRI